MSDKWFFSSHGALILLAHPVNGLVNILNLPDFQCVLAPDLSFISWRGIRQIWPPPLPISSSQHFGFSPPSLNCRYFTFSLFRVVDLKNMERVLLFLRLFLLFSPNISHPVKGECFLCCWGRHTASAPIQCLLLIIEWCFLGAFCWIWKNGYYFKNTCVLQKNVSVHNWKQSFFALNKQLIKSKLVFSKCISVFSFLHVCSSSTKSQGCQSLPAHRGREIHPGLERRQSCLPAAECHHCQQSSGGASAAARPGDMQVGPTHAVVKHPHPQRMGWECPLRLGFFVAVRKTNVKTVLKGRCLVSGGSTGWLTGRWLM